MRRFFYIFPVMVGVLIYLPVYYFQLREEPVHCNAANKVIVCWGGERGSELIPLEWIARPPDTYLLKGIYTRVGVSIQIAHLMGLYLPACIIILTIVLAFWMYWKSNKDTGEMQCVARMKRSAMRVGPGDAPLNQN